MEFADKIKSLAERAQKVKSNLSTEEATKTALVLPFIQALGYDVFNPLEVEPELVADVAGKKGEKIDYAIKHDNKPIIIIECKCCGVNLNAEKHEQLHRYFTTLDSRIAILTDGIKYLFYSDLEQAHKLDERPFMVIDLDDIDETLIHELKKLTKEAFDLETALSSAHDLRYNRQLKAVFKACALKPTDSFVEYCVREVFAGRLTQNIKDQFMPIVERAFNEFISESVDNRLKSALNTSPKKEEIEIEEIEAPKIITTKEELQALYLLKALLKDMVSPERIEIKDAQGHCSLVLDNIRKPIIRLYFNNIEKLSIEIIGNKEKIDIAKVEDILLFEEKIKQALQQYEI